MDELLDFIDRQPLIFSAAIAWFALLGIAAVYLSAKKKGRLQTKFHGAIYAAQQPRMYRQYMTWMSVGMAIAFIVAAALTVAALW